MIYSTSWSSSNLRFCPERSPKTPRKKSIIFWRKNKIDRGFVQKHHSMLYKKIGFISQYHFNRYWLISWYERGTNWHTGLFSVWGIRRSQKAHFLSLLSVQGIAEAKYLAPWVENWSDQKGINAIGSIVWSENRSQEILLGIGTTKHRKEGGWLG